MNLTSFSLICNIVTITIVKCCTFHVYLELKAIWICAWLIFHLLCKTSEGKRKLVDRDAVLLFLLCPIISFYCSRIYWLENGIILKHYMLEDTWDHTRNSPSIIPMEQCAAWVSHAVSDFHPSTSYFTTTFGINFCIGPKISPSLTLTTKTYHYKDLSQTWK